MVSQPVPQRLLSRRELAQAFRVTPKRITMWAAAGMPVAVQGGGRGRESRYSLSAVIEWAVVRRIGQEGSSGSGSDLITERTRLTKAMTARTLMDIASKRKELVQASEVKQLFGGIVLAIRAALLAIPRAAAERVVAASSEGPAAVEAVIMPMVLDALRPLREWPGKVLGESAEGDL